MRRNSPYLGDMLLSKLGIPLCQVMTTKVAEPMMIMVHRSCSRQLLRAYRNLQHTEYSLFYLMIGTETFVSEPRVPPAASLVPALLFLLSSQADHPR